TSHYGLVGRIGRATSENNWLDFKNLFPKIAFRFFTAHVVIFWHSSPDYDLASRSMKSLKLGACIWVRLTSIPTNGTATIECFERLSNAYASPPPFEPNRKRSGAYSATSYSLFNFKSSSMGQRMRYSLEPMKPSPPFIWCKSCT